LVSEKRWSSKSKLAHKAISISPDRIAGVLYPKNAEIIHVIQSLELIIADLKLSVKAQAPTQLQEV
jgi:hypothetical protein